MMIVISNVNDTAPAPARRILETTEAGTAFVSLRLETQTFSGALGGLLTFGCALFGLVLIASLVY